MVHEKDSAHGLWIHQESAAIFANSHDIGSFTPEFLLSSGIVPDDWVCTRATKNSDTITIEYGPVTWLMTESVLWITEYPDCSIEDDSRLRSGHYTAALARRYLEQVPYLPAQHSWSFWRLNVINPNSEEWMLSNFLRKGWPSEFGTPRLEPNLSFIADETMFQMTIKNEEAQRAGETFNDSVTFECFVSNIVDQSVGELAHDTSHWSTRLSTLAQVIGYLLQEDGSE